MSRGRQSLRPMAIQTFGGIWSVEAVERECRGQADDALGHQPGRSGQGLLRSERGVGKLVEPSVKAHDLAGSLHPADRGGSGARLSDSASRVIPRRLSSASAWVRCVEGSEPGMLSILGRIKETSEDLCHFGAAARKGHIIGTRPQGQSLVWDVAAEGTRLWAFSTTQSRLR